MLQKNVEKVFKNPRTRKSAVRLDLPGTTGNLDLGSPTKSLPRKTSTIQYQLTSQEMREISGTKSLDEELEANNITSPGSWKISLSWGFPLLPEDRI